VEYASLEEFKERAGYDIGGIWYPRVTSIINIKAKPALYRYYAGMPSFKAADVAKERSAVEGSLVHSTIETILSGKSVEIPESIRPSVEAFLEFRRHHDVTPLKVEEQIVSREHGYAGTIDILAEVDGVVGVLDIKTGKSIYRDYGLQTAAYIQALREDKDIPPPQTSWILRLDQARPCTVCGATLRTKGGNFRVKGNGVKGCLHSWGPMQGIFEFQEVQGYEQNIQAFLAAKRLWEWEHQELLEHLR
jgi:hypothetical protein